jgi:hypothetical protein
MAKTDQVDPGSTIRSKISIDPAAESNYKDKDLPALPIQALKAAGPGGVVLEGNALPKDVVTLEGLREPDAEKGIHDFKEYSVTSIKSTGGPPRGWI